MKGWLVRCWPAAAWLACLLLIGIAILQVQSIATTDTIRACEQYNAAVLDSNERTRAINAILYTLRHEHRVIVPYVDRSEPLDCEGLFQEPWPFGLVRDMLE
jgi:hypothetical protein